MHSRFLLSHSSSRQRRLRSKDVICVTYIDDFSQLHAVSLVSPLLEKVPLSVPCGMQNHAFKEVLLEILLVRPNSQLM